MTNPLFEDTPRSRSAPPPRVRGNLLPRAAIIASGLILAALLLIIVFNLETGTGAEQAVAAGDADDLRPPPVELDALQIAEGEGTATLDLSAAAERGWIERADPTTGELAQRYRFEQLDPDPPGRPEGWADMTRPHAEIFLGEERVLVLSSERALVYAPQRAIESGELRGDVLVQLYERAADGSMPDADDDPLLAVRTERAVYDNVLGEVRCDGDVLITTPTARFPGRALTMHLNDQDQRLEHLHVAYVEYVLLRRPGSSASSAASADAAAASGAGVAPAAPRAAGAGRGGGVADERGASSAASSAGEDVAGDAPDAGDTPRPLQFYHLRLADNIRVFDGTPTGGRTITGDELLMTFSSESDGLDGAFARGSSGVEDGSGSRATRRSASGVGVPASPLAFIVGCAIGPVPASTPPVGWLAELPDDLSAEDLASSTVILCDGPLTVTPIVDDSAAGLDPQDTALTLTGEPVVLRDLSEEAVATGRTLSYDSARDRFELVGEADEPVEVRSVQMQASGERFWLSRRDQRAGFHGSGWISAPQRAIAQRAAQQEDDEPGGSDEAREPSVRIEWSERVDLEFEEDSATGETIVKGATFVGDVRVDTREFATQADEMAVQFAGGVADAEQIEAIHARGNVVVDGVTGGRLRADSLDVALVQTADGSTIPQRLLAAGGVAAIDQDQALWADHVDVTFRPVDPDEAGDSRPAPDAADRDAVAGGRAVVDQFIARDNVQLRLPDGSRIFADTMHGDGVRETVVLDGEDLLIVSETMVIKRGGPLTVNRTSQHAHLGGGGVLFGYDQPMDLRSMEPIARPVVPDDGRFGDRQPQVRADWADDLLYEYAANDGAGAVSLAGEVHAVSEPTPLERNTISGNKVTLDFVHEALPEDAGVSTPTPAGATVEDDAAPPDAPSRATADAPAGTGARPMRESRRLGGVLVRGDGQIETRAWSAADHAELERVFYVAGQHIEYDDRTMHARVIGDGTMFIADVRADEAGGEAAAERRADVPFGAKGRTLFEWQEQLEVTRGLDGRFEATMTGEVGVRHQSLAGETAQLTTQHLEATLLRDRVADAADKSTLDLGGPTELRRLRAEGDVHVVTETRVVDCHEFEYNRVTEMAEMAARPAQRLTIRTRGTASVLQARRVRWNLLTDSVTILDAGGSGGR